jgi:hypothetical protein
MESMVGILHCINLIWITDILEQQCIMTVITVMKFQAGPKLAMEYHKSLFWDLYIFFLPMIINKTSAHIIFADDTSILYAHSNLIDFNKNIHKVFITLNKWFRVNQLSLNFNKTIYVHFTTKRNMSVNLKIGVNNNLITNCSYTKFLGMTVDNTLSWNNHIDVLMKKLSKAF